MDAITCTIMNYGNFSNLIIIFNFFFFFFFLSLHNYYAYHNIVFIIFNLALANNMLSVSM